MKWTVGGQRSPCRLYQRFQLCSDSVCGGEVCASRHGVAADGGIGVVDVVNSHAVLDRSDSA